MKQRIKKLATAIRKIETLKIIQRILIAIILILIVVLIIRKPGDNSAGELDTTNTLREVRLATVAELSSETAPLVVTGTVRSQTEAMARAETQGQIITLNYNLGNRVARGAVIASVENSRERALVAQAEAALAQARAALTQAENLTEVGLENAQQALEESKNNAKNTISSAFSSADDAIRNRADTMFYNAQTSNPTLIFQVPTSQELEFILESGRPKIEGDLIAWSSLVTGLGNDSSELIAVLEQSEQYLKNIKTFLDQASLAVNSLTPNSTISSTDIATWKGNISAARSSINAVLPSITGALTGIRANTTAVEIALEDFEQSNSATSGTTASASLAQAEATLRSAEVGLEKTIIRAPVSGTITSLDIDRGDFVSPAQPVATISNTNAFEVVTYLTERDARDLIIGTPVMINGTLEGGISTISPRIDANTKKREITIDMDDIGNLLNGQSVRIAIERNGSGSNLPENMFVPLSALKVTSEGVVTLTVNEENEITYLPITIGPLTGEKVLVLEGLEFSNTIVTDVRGLSEGNEVTLVE